MGSQSGAICNQCETHFTVNDGGGFFFHLLRCDTCGAGKSISFEEIGEPHLRYLKGLKVPYCMATDEHDRKVRETYKGKPMTRDEYHAAVEELCGKCDCGGQFRLDAPARCPRCRSENHRQDPEGGFICYD
ncbi:MAG: hypothetical protein WCP21_02155 [Armatimonadota bacterium]